LLNIPTKYLLRGAIVTIISIPSFNNAWERSSIPKEKPSSQKKCKTDPVMSVPTTKTLQSISPTSNFSFKKPISPKIDDYFKANPSIK